MFKALVLSVVLLCGGVCTAVCIPHASTPCGGCPSCGCPCTQASLEQEVLLPYVEFMDKSDTCIGAGSVIEYKGKVYILTAGHVVAALNPKDENGVPLSNEKKCHLRKVDEQGKQYQTWEGRVVALHYDLEVDLGLVEVPNPKGLTPAKFKGDVKLHRGQDCWYIGTPGRLHAWLEKSIIARPEFYSDLYHDWDPDGDYEEVLRVGVNGNGWYGNSGGGLYVEDSGHFYLVGVIVELARPGEKSPLLAIPQSMIQDFLDCKSQWKVQ